VKVSLARELWMFVAPRRRGDNVDVPYDGDASLGHIVQALGVPLTEVGALLADYALVDPAYRPRAGATVEIRPVARPQRVPGSTGFLLDVHLGTLARRLRILGINTAYSNDASDDVLVHQAAGQRRVLLTQDRGLLMRRALWAGAYVRGRGADEQLADVLHRFAPPLAPWTLCTSCNGEWSGCPSTRSPTSSNRAPGGATTTSPGARPVAGCTGAARTAAASMQSCRLLARHHGKVDPVAAVKHTLGATSASRCSRGWC
jgi:hypothetical protein